LLTKAVIQHERRATNLTFRTPSFYRLNAKCETSDEYREHFLSSRSRWLPPAHMNDENISQVSRQALEGFSYCILLILEFMKNQKHSHHHVIDGDESRKEAPASFYLFFQNVYLGRWRCNLNIIIHLGCRSAKPM
ncbi:MAG TPA: hypothetical protein DEB05_09060, partial [Firmicutes bacterium]|nr:hypothetical protein [Bacillota bacterium]